MAHFVFLLLSSQEVYGYYISPLSETNLFFALTAERKNLWKKFDSMLNILDDNIILNSNK